MTSRCTATSGSVGSGHAPGTRIHLRTNYRNSAEIYDYAAAYAERVGLEADLPDAVRTTGVEPEERTVSDVEAGVREAVGRLLTDVEGTVGVVVPVARRTEVARWLRRRAGLRRGPGRW